MANEIIRISEEAKTLGILSVDVISYGSSGSTLKFHVQDKCELISIKFREQDKTFKKLKETDSHLLYECEINGGYLNTVIAIIEATYFGQRVKFKLERMLIHCDA